VIRFSPDPDDRNRHIRIHTIEELEAWLAARKPPRSEADPPHSLHLTRGCLPSHLSCHITTSQSSVWRCGVCFFELIPNTTPLNSTYFRVVRKDVPPGVSPTNNFNFQLLEQSRKRGCRTCTSVEQVLLNFKHPRSGLKRDQQLLGWGIDNLEWTVTDNGVIMVGYTFNLIARSVYYNKDGPRG
jgi:hypothetical protein